MPLPRTPERILFIVAEQRCQTPSKQILGCRFVNTEEALGPIEKSEAAHSVFLLSLGPARDFRFNAAPASSLLSLPWTIQFFRPMAITRRLRSAGLLSISRSPSSS